MPRRNPELLKVQGSETMPEPIIVFQHVKIVVIEVYFLPGSLFVKGLGKI